MDSIAPTRVNYEAGGRRVRGAKTSDNPSTLACSDLGPRARRDFLGDRMEELMVPDVDHVNCNLFLYYLLLTVGTGDEKEKCAEILFLINEATLSELLVALSPVHAVTCLVHSIPLQPSDRKMLFHRFYPCTSEEPASILYIYFLSFLFPSTVILPRTYGRYRSKKGKKEGIILISWIELLRTDRCSTASCSSAISVQERGAHLFILHIFVRLCLL